jgi:GT2 family glycosyltransferase
MSKVAVQLLSWNGEKYLRACLDSLAKQSFPDFELLVMDNGSSDGSVAIIEEAIKVFPHPSRFVKMKTNLGFSGGHNELFAMSNTPYIFCVNQDVVLSDDYLKIVVELLEKRINAGSSAGVLRHNDGSIDSAGLDKSWYGKTKDIVRVPGEAEIKVFGVSGALPVYRRAAVLQASQDGKLFDGNFISYKEDVDLAWRLEIFGWSAFVAANAKAIHVRGFGSDKKGDAAEHYRQKLSSRNHLLTLVKDLPAAGWWLLPAIIFYELGKAAYLAVFVPKSLGYIGEFFQMLPESLKVRKVFWQKLKAMKNNG